MNQYNLLDILENGTESERVIAAETIGKLGIRDAAPALMKALQQTSVSKNRNTIILALGKTGHPEVVPFLLEYGGTKSYSGMFGHLVNHELELTVAEALGNANNLNTLIEALKHENQRVRRIAAKAIGNMSL
jgi:HEAT repeat protein